MGRTLFSLLFLSVSVWGFSQAEPALRQTELLASVTRVEVRMAVLQGAVDRLIGEHHGTGPIGEQAAQLKESIATALVQFSRIKKLLTETIIPPASLDQLVELIGPLEARLGDWEKLLLEARADL